jgi:hypothetical protein
MKLNTKSLAQVEIGIPIIAEGIYHAKMAKVEVKPNKKGDGNNLVVMFKILDNPVFLHKDGAEIENKGQVVCTRHFSLVPTPDYDPDKSLKELAIAIKLPEDKDLEVADLVDKLVMVKLSYKEASKDKNTGKDYQDGNDIKRDPHPG